MLRYAIDKGWHRTGIETHTFVVKILCEDALRAVA